MSPRRPRAAADLPVPVVPPDGRLGLADLTLLAREFDQISDGEHWPALEFVAWLQREHAALLMTGQGQRWRLARRNGTGPTLAAGPAPTDQHRTAPTTA